jgi:hypothetical protein
MAGAILLSEEGLVVKGPAVFGPVMVLYLAILVGVAAWLFNPRGTSFLPGTTLEQQIVSLERAGLLQCQSFEATRAFRVEEFEDEGSSYFVELRDGSVLFLSGQYLYDYEPTEEGADESQPRRFPNTRFTVQRHAKAGYVVDLLCLGDVLEPELTAAPFSPAELRRGRVPSDGEIIRDRSYEEIKAERQGQVA